jgi:putative SOS response-associated peptidase YedK
MTDLVAIEGKGGFMCGRFNVIDNPGLQQLLRDLGIDLKLPTAINVAPTEEIPLVRNDDAGASLAAAHWWLVPSWAREISQKYSMFNARSETLGRSPAFRRPFKCQRGLVPMSSFIEWRPEGGVKQPWLITNDQQALAVAALWDIWEGGDRPLLSCTLVTTGAAPQFEPWHARMPVVLTPDESERWLDNSRVIAPDDPLFRAELKMPLYLQPLSRAVSNARNKQLQVLEGEGDLTVLSP